MGAIPPFYTIGAFFSYWLISVLIQSFLLKIDKCVGSYLLRDFEIEFIDLDTQVGTKVLLYINRSYYYEE